MLPGAAEHRQAVRLVGGQHGIGAVFGVEMDIRGRFRCRTVLPVAADEHRELILIRAGGAADVLADDHIVLPALNDGIAARQRADRARTQHEILKVGVRRDRPELEVDRHCGKRAADHDGTVHLRGNKAGVHGGDAVVHK